MWSECSLKLFRNPRQYSQSETIFRKSIFQNFRDAFSIILASLIRFQATYLQRNQDHDHLKKVSQNYYWLLTKRFSCCCKIHTFLFKFFQKLIAKTLILTRIDIANVVFKWWNLITPIQNCIQACTMSFFLLSKFVQFLEIQHNYYNHLYDW